MENTSSNNKKEYYVIDLLHIITFIWYKIWVVILAGVFLAAAGFGLSAFLIEPTYSSSIMLYVNNNSVSLGDVGFSISSSQIDAAQSLVKTYNVLLQNRTTLERVIAQADVEYGWRDLSKMIEASAVNGTEVMEITVTTNDPYESQKIANGVAVVLPQRVAEIVEGASMEVVDSAIANHQKVAPIVRNYTAIGFILGALLAVGILAVVAMLDNTIHDEDYILQNYHYPILAKIPDLMDTGSGRYGYKYRYRNYHRYGKYGKNKGETTGIVDPGSLDNTDEIQ